MKALSFVDLYNSRIWPLYNLTRALTHLPDFWSYLHVPKDTAQSTCVDELMLMPLDVIR